MKKTIFKADYDFSYENNKEAYQPVYRRTIGRSQIFIALILIGCLLLSTGEGGISSELVPTSIIVIFWVFIIFIGKKNTVKKMFGIQKNLYHKDFIKTEVSFFDDEILLDNLESKGEIVLYYNQINFIKETKNLYVIGFGENQYFFVGKDRFKVGEPSKFVEFIKKKKNKKKEK